MKSLDKLEERIDQLRLTQIDTEIEILKEIIALYQSKVEMVRKAETAVSLLEIERNKIKLKYEEIKE